MPPQNNRLREEEIEAHRLLTQSMNMLSERIQRTEADFISHLRKVEERLDQIVDLTKTVAVLQSQTSTQGDSISDIRASQREHFQKIDGSVTRIHTRIEEVQNHTRDKFELLTKEVEISVGDAVKKITAELKETNGKVSTNEHELKQWLNRGWGAWAIFVLVLTIGSSGMYKWVDSLEKEKEVVVKTLSATVSQLDKTTTIVARLDDENKNIRTDLKRIDLSISDLDRQLEFMRKK